MIFPPNIRGKKSLRSFLKSYYSANILSVNRFVDFPYEKERKSHSYVHGGVIILIRQYLLRKSFSGCPEENHRIDLLKGWCRNNNLSWPSLSEIYSRFQFTCTSWNRGLGRWWWRCSRAPFHLWLHHRPFRTPAMTEDSGAAAGGRKAAPPVPGVFCAWFPQWWRRQASSSLTLLLAR